jgi:hypothetical protein
LQNGSLLAVAVFSSCRSCNIDMFSVLPTLLLS